VFKKAATATVAGIGGDEKYTAQKALQDVEFSGSHLMPQVQSPGIRRLSGEFFSEMLGGWACVVRVA